MVEAFAVASGKGGTGKTTSTLALGMALATEYDVTVIDADTGMANMLFHAGLSDVETTLHEVLAGDARVEDAVYECFGVDVVPCGTSLSGFRQADPLRLQEVMTNLATETEVILLDSAAALGSRSAVLPVVLADRVVIVLQPTVPSLSDGLKVQGLRECCSTASPRTRTSRRSRPKHSGTSRGRPWRRYQRARLHGQRGGRTNRCWHTRPIRRRRGRIRRLRPR